MFTYSYLFLFQDNFIVEICFLQIDIHSLINYRAEQDLKANIGVVDTWPEFLVNLDAKKLSMIPFCLAKDCEDEIKKLSARLVFFFLLAVVIHLLNCCL